jgi:hypothetical protein
VINPPFDDGVDGGAVVVVVGAAVVVVVGGAVVVVGGVVVGGAVVVVVGAEAGGVVAPPPPPPALPEVLPDVVLVPEVGAGFTTGRPYLRPSSISTIWFITDCQSESGA